MNLMLILACTPIGDTPLQIQDAADAFLLGDPELADALFSAGEADVLSEIRDRDLADTDPESYLALLEAEWGADAPQAQLLEDQSCGFIEELDEIIWSESAIATIPEQEMTEGTAPICRLLTAGAECAESDFMVSAYMGHSTQPEDADEYVNDFLTYYNNSPVARALIGEPTVRSYRVEWQDNPDGPHHFNAYACLPWQINRLEATMLFNHW